MSDVKRGKGNGVVLRRGQRVRQTAMKQQMGWMIGLRNDSLSPTQVGSWDRGAVFVVEWSGFGGRDVLPTASEPLLW